MGFCCKILSLLSKSLFTMTTSQRACKPVMTTRAFSRRNQHRAKVLCWKSGGRKKVLVMLGYHSIQLMLSIKHDKSDFGRNSPLTERRTSSANHLFTLHTAAHADHREAIPILHVKYRAQFLLGVGWGGMSYWVYVTLSCHNWKRNDFHYSGAYLFTSFVYCTNVYWSVIHGIKRKPHLSVVWNWYHFVAIAILHQPRPTDSADINTRLQLSDTSSIPPMHGGFLLWLPRVPGQVSNDIANCTSCHGEHKSERSEEVK